MNLAEDLLSVLFPRLCHVCKNKLNGREEYVCGKCLDELPRTMYHRIPLNAMEQRFAGKVRFEKATSLFFYDRNSRYANIIHDFKYRGYSKLAKYMGQYMANELLTTGFFNDIDSIVPIPLHRFKQARRGYNQSLMIACGLSEILEIPVDDVLKVSRWRRTQTMKSLYERWLNAKDAFRLKDGADVSGKHILLVDDVCTTGSTIEAAIHAFDDIADMKFSILSLATTH